MELEFEWEIFEKILKCEISWKICPVGAELFHADRQTWRS